LQEKRDGTGDCEGLGFQIPVPYRDRSGEDGRV
jgi:hypothetical protein